MSASLHTQTRQPNISIQVLNDSLTSVPSNLEHGLVILTESFSPLRYMSSTTSLVEVQSRSDAISHAIPDTVYLTCTNNQFWPVPTWLNMATATKVDVIAKRQCLVENSISWWSKVDDDVRLPLVWLPGLQIPII